MVSGECTVLPGDEDSFCTISFEFPEGTLAIQGVFFRVMTITGATGCFTGLTGLVEGDVLDVGEEDDDDDFVLEYSFTVDGIADQDLNCNDRIFEFPWFETGEDQFLDYDRSGSVTPGDMFVFDDHPVFVSALGINGVAAGRCMIIEEIASGNNSFCSIVFAFRTGELVLQGFFDDMTIVAGSGCFTGVVGTAQVVGSNNIFEYNFQIGDPDEE